MNKSIKNQDGGWGKYDDKEKQWGNKYEDKKPSWREDKYAIPEYNEPTNNPMITNTQKAMYAADNMRKKEKPPMVDFSFKYAPPPKPQWGNSTNQQMPNPSVFTPTYSFNPFDPLVYAQYMQQVNYANQRPIFNEYTINIKGVSGSHLKTQRLFQDILPVKNVANSFRSIEERTTMYEAIRANLFDKGDGNDVSIENNTYNLLSYLKLMDMNPYNAARYTNNPYMGLPFGLLLFRSCYPIKHDTFHHTSMCAHNSTGINVRIYRLTDGAYYVNKHNMAVAADYDEWRDIFFYNYIKEYIIKQKMCPHFPFMYGYHITLNSNINFDELKRNQTTSIATNTKNQPQQLLPHPQPRQTVLPPPHTLPTAPQQPAVPQRQQIVHPSVQQQNALMNAQPVIPTFNPAAQQNNAQSNTINLQKYTGKSIVCLTEASNYSIIGWAKKEYKITGNINTMINTGYHAKSVWFSIYFQLLVALYVMQLKGIIINDFKLDRNVFIKDISLGGQNTQFWKYKINGIEYFIPNFGYLLIIDTNYKDFDRKYSDNVPNSDIHKLDGKFIDTFNMTQNNINETVFKMFVEAINPNNYGNDFINSNGIKPPEEVITLLTTMKNEADAKLTLDISAYIRKYMTMFIHNRVGTVLTDLEKTNIKRGALKDFRPGQLVVHLDNDNEEKCVIHINFINANTSRIITKDKLDPNTANFIEKDVHISSLNDYSVIHPIRQKNKYDANFNDDMLLETYTIE